APPRWLRFSVPVRVPDGRPMLAIVIDDMGVDRRRSGRVMSLKGPLTLSFLTYADDLDRQTREAADAGHELMLHVAMAPRNERLDAGPNVLESGLDPTELRRRLAWGLARFGTFVGINNHMGSQFTADAEGMRVVMETLRDRGLLFLDSRTTADTVGARVAHEVGVPVVERNVFLDNVNTEKAVRARLDEAIAIARKRGYAVAIGHPRDATIAVLSDWLGRAADEGIAVVPVTAVVKR
ncbi:MAG: divergent polysaccharide deacetylase family protein, partial [Rhodobacterales bacterium]|nr:divergent polysaccharide deacetylase family protein [Rhodobacterales bacterium]